MAKYFYIRDGKAEGPIPPSEFRAAGLHPDDKIAAEGDKQWTTISQHPDLMAFALPPTPPQPQRPQTYPGQPPMPGNNIYPQQGFDRPPTNMVWAILTTIFCCLPFGIVSIVYAAKVDGLWNAGELPEAIDASQKARQWALVSLIVSLVCGVIYFIVMDM